MAGPPRAAKNLFTSSEAATFLKIQPVILRWICLTEGIDRERVGHTKLLTRELVDRIDQILRSADPAGECRIKKAISVQKVERFRINSTRFAGE